MPTPMLGEIVYVAYAKAQPTPQPLYKALSYAERMGWALGVHAAVEAVIAPEMLVGVAEGHHALLAAIAKLRGHVRAVMCREGLSMKRAGRVMGIDRHTLQRLLEGEENVSVHTLLSVEAWVEGQP